MDRQILIYALIVGICILRQAFAIKDNALITYSGIVVPPSYYKVVIWDKLNQSTAVKCSKTLFTKVNRMTAERQPITLDFFKYYKEAVKLEDFKLCFLNFYSIQTEPSGKFEIEMSAKIGDKIFVHIFPLDEQKNLIPSMREHAVFLQNVFQRDQWKESLFQRDQWKDLGIQKNTLFIYPYNIFNDVVNESLYHLLIKNHQPSKEDIYFLIASFKEITDRVLNNFTSGVCLTPLEKERLEIFGCAFNQFLKGNGPKIFGHKMAQIDCMMPTLVQQFCQFFGYGEVMNAPNGKDFLQLSTEWKQFCAAYIGGTSVPEAVPSANNALDGGNKAQSAQQIAYGNKLMPQKIANPKAPLTKPVEYKTGARRGGTGVFIPAGNKF